MIRVPPITLEPNEPLRSGEQILDVRVIDFWRWAHSDLVVNIERGVLAEFLVAFALGLHSTVRMPWHPFDLETPDGLTIEVKSASYLQRWLGRGPSRIEFGIAPTRAEDPITAQFAAEAKRQAHVYVFAHLHHVSRESLNPLDVSQWTFYVAPTPVLESRFGNRRSITLTQVRSVAESVSFDQLANAIRCLPRIAPAAP